MRRLVISVQYICIAILLSFLESSLLAQQIKIDSLKNQMVDASPKDSLAVATELVIVYGNETDDNISALQYARIANTLGWKLGDSLAIVTSGRRMGQLYSRLNDIDSQLLISEKILPIARRNGFEGERGKILNVIGAVYVDKSKYDLALQYFFESLVIAEKEGDRKAVGVTLFNIGYLYYKIRDNDRAVKYFNNALQIKTEISDPLKTETLLLNLSLCYSAKHDFKMSRKYINQVQELCRVKNCTVSTKLELEVAEGLHFLRSDSLVEAEECFLRGQPLALYEQHTRLGLDCILNLSKIYLKQGKIDLATRYLKAAEKSENITGFNNELLQLYAQLVSVYKKANNYEMAAHYQDQYIQLKDSVSGDNVRNNLMRVQAEYMERENEAKIRSQAELLLLQDKVIERQKIVRNLVLVVVTLLILLGFILYLINRNRKATSALLDLKVTERTKELEMSYRELKVAVEQRDTALKKVAQEIRSSIASVKGLCVIGAIEVNLPETKDRLKKIDEASSVLLTMFSDLTKH